MGTLKPGPCSVMSWAEHRMCKRCMCEQHMLKGFWFPDIIPGQLRQPCGVPQASLPWPASAQSSASSVCIKLVLFQGVFLLRSSCHLWSGDNSSYYPLWRVLLSLVKCYSQGAEWSWAVHALGLVLPAWSLSPCRTWSMSIHLLSPEQYLKKVYVFLFSA